MLLREAADRMPQPRAAILDSRTMRSTPESGGRAGWDGRKRTRGIKVHAAVDALGHLLALVVTPASEQDRTQVEALAATVQEPRGRRLSSPSSTRATPESRLARTPRRTAFGWK